MSKVAPLQQAMPLPPSIIVGGHSGPWSGLMGTYDLNSSKLVNGRPVYMCEGMENDQFVYWSSGDGGRWCVTDDEDDMATGIQGAIKSASVGAGLPVGLSYLFLSGSAWQHDAAIGVHPLGTGAQMQQPLNSKQPTQPQQPLNSTQPPAAATSVGYAQHQQQQPVLLSPAYGQPRQLEQQPSQARANPADRNRRGSATAQELQELFELHKQGILDDEEFKAAKAKVIKRMGNGGNGDDGPGLGHKRDRQGVTAVLLDGHRGPHKPLMGLYACTDGAMANNASLYKKERTSNRGTYYYMYRHSHSGRWMVTHMESDIAQNLGPIMSSESAEQPTDIRGWRCYEKSMGWVDDPALTAKPADPPPARPPMQQEMQRGREKQRPPGPPAPMRGSPAITEGKAMAMESHALVSTALPQSDFGRVDRDVDLMSMVSDVTMDSEVMGSQLDDDTKEFFGCMIQGHTGNDWSGFMGLYEVAKTGTIRNGKPLFVKARTSEGNEGRYYYLYASKGHEHWIFTDELLDIHKDLGGMRSKCCSNLPTDPGIGPWSYFDGEHDEWVEDPGIKTSVVDIRTHKQGEVMASKGRKGKHLVKVCEHCGKTGARHECPACKAVTYCNAQCLNLGRKEHDKKACREAARLKKKNMNAKGGAANADTGLLLESIGKQRDASPSERLVDIEEKNFEREMDAIDSELDEKKRDEASLMPVELCMMKVCACVCPTQENRKPRRELSSNSWGSSQSSWAWK